MPTVAGDRNGNEYIERAHTRQPWAQTVQITWLSAGGRPARPVEVRGIDISRGGVALLSRSFVHVGTRGVLLVQAPGSNPRLLCIEVCHCRYAGLWRHIVGARWAAMPQGLPVEIRHSDNGPILFVNDWSS